MSTDDDEKPANPAGDTASDAAAPAPEKKTDQPDTGADAESLAAAEDEVGNDDGYVELDESGEESVRNLIHGALGKADAPPSSDVLAGVQRRIRQRSGGKYYADGWSTAKHPPVSTYLVTSALMLAIVIVAYIVMSPLRGEPAPVEMEPAPVRVLPPQKVQPAPGPLPTPE